jgi:uncharacterized membrane protein YdbT with pleckstrin-like domain
VVDKRKLAKAAQDKEREEKEREREEKDKQEKAKQAKEREENEKHEKARQAKEKEEREKEAREKEKWQKPVGPIELYSRLLFHQRSCIAARAGQLARLPSAYLTPFQVVDIVYLLILCTSIAAVRSM